jgi:hypothetical protein
MAGSPLADGRFSDLLVLLVESSEHQMDTCRDKRGQAGFAQSFLEELPTDNGVGYCTACPTVPRTLLPLPSKTTWEGMKEVLLHFPSLATRVT